MYNIPPINLERIEEMADGDSDFRYELIVAIHTSLTELKEKYLEGAENENSEAIHHIRHKVKPTMSLFEIERLRKSIQDGKEIIEEKGFKAEFLEHLEEFLDAWQEVFDFVSKEMNKK
ncbi:hypothetical protein MM213_00195 [Belliella sp. R4-6]|uniref:HPt domain-containing protein n=1 Tax=Belliella alkalica TaxID=1730871 RepID=A0ABS9V644_9BACT|nr:hypothetical protein [Belliella alkalica]MCH7411888.1 hypothetical protein [Belliella alkalica]